MQYAADTATRPLTMDILVRKNNLSTQFSRHPGGLDVINTPQGWRHIITVLTRFSYHPVPRVTSYHLWRFGMPRDTSFFLCSEIMLTAHQRNKKEAEKEKC